MVAVFYAEVDGLLLEKPSGESAEGRKNLTTDNVFE